VRLVCLRRQGAQESRQSHGRAAQRQQANHQQDLLAAIAEPRTQQQQRYPSRDPAKPDFHVRAALLSRQRRDQKAIEQQAGEESQAQRGQQVQQRIQRRAERATAQPGQDDQDADRERRSQN
jgi:hypothetical protein